MSFGPNIRNGVGLGLGSTPSLLNSPPYATLNFRFNESTSLDPRISFSRASGATYINSAGSLAWADSNQMLYSEELNQAGSWTLAASTISANATTAPDGTLTADKIVEDLTNAAHSAQQNVTTQSFQYTFSAYVKAAGRNYVLLYHSQSTAGQLFDLTTGAVATTGGVNAPVSASSSSVGNGWIRCSITVNCTDASNNFRILPAPSAGSTTWVYTGDGSSGIYAWGVQLNNDGLQPYNKTTTAAYYSPRFDYNPTTLANLGFLVEPARTNSIRNNYMVGAVAGSPGTFPTNWTTSGSGLGTLTQTIVGTGTQNGIKYIDIRLNGTSSTVSYGFAFEGSTQIVATPGQTWASSFWYAVVGGSTTNITSIANLMFERTAAGSALTFPSSGPLPVSSTMTRSAFTYTTVNASTARISSAVLLSFASGAAIDITLRIGLPQLELGSGASSVIPTTTTALTRAADVALMSGANFSDWYNQTQGTFVVDCDTVNLNGVATFFAATDAATTDSLSLAVNNGARRGIVVDNSVTQYDSSGLIGSNSSGVPVKSAIAYANADFASVGAGGTVNSATSGTLPTVDRLYIGANQSATSQLTGHVRSIEYFPRRLSNGMLQTLTK